MDPYQNEAVLNGDNKDANSSSQTQEENEAVQNGDNRDANSSNQTQAQNDRENEDVSGKIFVGGLAGETTSAELVNYFSKYGEITDSVIIKDRSTGQPRGCGFVTYADPYMVDKVLQDTHIISGKQVGIRKYLPRGSMGANDSKNRIFVGGIPARVTGDELKTFFMQFGEVKEHRIILDRITNRPCGYGFITFESEKSVNDLLVNGNTLELAGAQMVIKKAEPKKQNQPPDSAYGAYGGYYRGELSGYGGYGATGGGMGPYRGVPPLAYSSGYGTGFYRGSYMGGGYGGLGYFYSGGYGGSAGPGGAGAGYGSGYHMGFGGGYGGLGYFYSGGYGSSAGPGGAGADYGSGYHMGLGGGYGGSSGSSMYESRDGYSGSGSGAGASGSRYHPYQR